MFKSIDGGRTFLPFVGDPTGDDYHTLWIDPDNSNRMISGVDQGTGITVNGGKTWSSWYNQATGQFYHVITDNQFPYWIYGAQQDSGAAAVPSRSGDYDGINMMQFHEVTAGGESGNIAPDPDDPDLVYGGTVDKLDRHTEQTQDVDPTLAYPDIYRSVWTLPLTFSPKDKHALYFANQHLFRTADGGKHWTLISPDLTRKTLSVPPNLDPPTVADTAVSSGRRGVIYAIAPSPRQADEIWTGTDDGLIWLTRDGGRHWQDVTPSQLTPWSKVGIIEAGHFSADTAYAAIDRHRLDDYKPYIYRTHDGGKHWTEVSDGIPDGSFVNVVREDPLTKGLLYAGTEFGMYVSFDDGDHWQSLQMNLPVTSVRDIDVHKNDLVIAT
ncbi:MAG: WD40/YVTN/BNR-like repeat-containing protein, partial [Gammaproteobacteria bacterium]